MRPSALALAVALGLATIQPVLADPVEDFYKGKQIRLLIGFASGGYDTYARMLGPVMSKYLPGRPTFVPQNMPGASSLGATNYLYSVALRDGTVIAVVEKAIATLPLFGGGEAKFKSGAEFSWLGSMNQEFSVLVAWHTTGFTKLQDVVEHELLVGASSPGADSMSLYPGLSNELLGTKLKIIYGYNGGNDLTFALERGEIHGRVWTWSTIKSERSNWLRDRKINVLMQWAMKRSDDLPDVPAIGELARNQADHQLMQLIFGPQAMARPFLAPPGVPANRLKALRDAFDAAVKDEELLAEAEKRNLSMLPISGLEVQSIIEELYKSPPEVVKRAIDLVPKK